jgi:hypothetical protein
MEVESHSRSQDISPWRIPFTAVADLHVHPFHVATAWHMVGKLEEKKETLSGQILL